MSAITCPEETSSGRRGWSGICAHSRRSGVHEHRHQRKDRGAAVQASIRDFSYRHRTTAASGGLTQSPTMSGACREQRSGQPEAFGPVAFGPQGRQTRQTSLGLIPVALNTAGHRRSPRMRTLDVGKWRGPLVANDPHRRPTACDSRSPGHRSQGLPLLVGEGERHTRAGHAPVIPSLRSSS